MARTLDPVNWTFSTTPTKSTTTTKATAPTTTPAAPTYNYEDFLKKYTSPQVGAGQYINPMGGYLTGYVPAVGGASYMWTPVAQLEKDLGITAPTTNYGGGGGGGGGGAPPITWSEGYTVDNAPPWWRGYVPSARSPEADYFTLINALIPSLSPEDQRSVASNLYRATGGEFGYNPEEVEFGEAPSKMTTEIRDMFSSKERAEQALGTLSKVQEVLGIETPQDFGAGYQYLRNLLDVLQDYGGAGEGERQTRQQATEMQAQLDPLLAEAKSGELSAYQGLVERLATPYFTAGQVLPISKAGGKYVFGTPNPQLF